MINFDKQAAALEAQQEAEANSIKAEFEQILQLADANAPAIKAALMAANVAGEQITPLLRAAAVASAAPAARPTPGGESYDEGGEV